MSAGPVEVFIGLGANLGDARAHLWAGRRGLEDLAGYRPLAISSLYRTAPVGVTDQPAFLNAVARGMFEGDPLDLLDALLAIEADQGRQRRQRWGPRTLDLDLLLFGDQVVTHERLTLPHPEMHRRVFVLAPLGELVPELVLPVWGQTAAQLLAGLSDQERQAQKVERVAWD